jgi:D-alanyl-lipoteichoic acid acyltransferase DltB (MBOAT superfamily)
MELPLQPGARQGLYSVHKVWSDHTRSYYLKLRTRPTLGRIVEIAGIVLTFHFVVIGWVWFALPDIRASWDVFLRLFSL